MMLNELQVRKIMKWYAIYLGWIIKAVDQLLPFTD